MGKNRGKNNFTAFELQDAGGVYWDKEDMKRIYFENIAATLSELRPDLHDDPGFCCLIAELESKKSALYYDLTLHKFYCEEMPVLYRKMVITSIKGNINKNRQKGDSEFLIDFDILTNISWGAELLSNEDLYKIDDIGRSSSSKAEMKFSTAILSRELYITAVAQYNLPFLSIDDINYIEILEKSDEIKISNSIIKFSLIKEKELGLIIYKTILENRKLYE